MLARATGLVLLLSTSVLAQTPATAPVGRFPHIQVDAVNKQVRIECQALNCQAPLEFFCVVNGTNEHESVLRTPAKPSHLHTALLMLGLEAGEPVRYSEAAKKWFPPTGPPLSITVEFLKDGKGVRIPAHKLMRDIKTKKPMPTTHWIFAGSRIMPDAVYAADVTGYVVSIVNFDLTVIDIPQLASNANDTLEWEADLSALPPLGTAVTLIIEPIDKQATPRPAPATQLSDVSIDQQGVDRLREKWQQQVKPHANAVREAAQAQYEVISALRREQQRLIDEADRIQRLIDELEKEYQEMTTPRPQSSKE